METVEKAQQTVWEIILEIWNYELITIDELPLTVKRLVLGLSLILFSVFISRRISGFAGRRVFPRFRINPGAGAALETLTFYSLVALLTLIALRIANVPLDMFAVFGGALAIGVGLGGQNIANNFISGLILLMERPIKQGDMIEVGGTFGAVENIGARSTTVRTPDNTHIVVPNSALLEKDVINWTLSDNTVRTMINVGVAYGSNTRKCDALLKEAVQDHERVLRTPLPIVLFTDFGDNALGFRVHFWLSINSVTDRLIIESDIRHRIDELFRAANIVIAFPQRDVHIDSLGPLDVRMVREGSAQAG